MTKRGNKEIKALLQTMANSRISVFQHFEFFNFQISVFSFSEVSSQHRVSDFSISAFRHFRFFNLSPGNADLQVGTSEMPAFSLLTSRFSEVGQ